VGREVPCLRKITLDMFYRCSSEDFIRREKEIQTMILDLMRQQQELAERQEALRYIKLIKLLAPVVR
jgi:hypothetical protein